MRIDPSSALWLDGVDVAADGQPQLRALHANGRSVRVVHRCLRDALETPVAVIPKAWEQRRRTDAVSFRDVSLATAEPLRCAGAWRRRALPGTGTSDRHAVYKTAASSRHLYFPAFLLMQVLFARSARIASILFRPLALDFMVKAGAVLRNRTIELEVGRDWPVTLMTDDSVRMLAWLAVATDARHSWASIHRHAYERGHLALVLPDVLISGWGWGVEHGDDLIVASVAGARVTYPYAVDRVVVTRRGARREVEGRGFADSWTSFGRRRKERRSPFEFATPGPR